MARSTEHPHSGTAAPSSSRSSRRLASARQLARLAIIWERLWPLLLPFTAIVTIYLIVSWLGIWPLLNNFIRLLALFLFAGFAIAALIPLRKFSMPSRHDIDTRVEIQSGLQHNPIAAQNDELANLSGSDDPFAKALWREHQARMAKELSELKSGLPNPQVAKHDPYALRALLVLGLFVAFFATNGNAVSSLGDAFRDHSLPPIATARIDAWIKPPAYTNKPPIFLSRAGGGGAPIAKGLATVPEGSELVVRILELENPAVQLSTVSGETNITPETENETANKMTAEGAAQSYKFKTKLTESGSATLLSRNHPQVSWSFKVTPDKNPFVAFRKEPQSSLRGALELEYELDDDYGIASARADIQPLQNISKTTRPLIMAPEISLALPGGKKRTGKAKTSKDLSSHPWAGSKVVLTLIAKDHAGQEAKTEASEFDLPGRIFTKPLARAIVFERRRLAMDANVAKDVAEMLDVITTTHPDIFIPNLSHYTALRVTYHHLKRAQNDDALREGLEQLWQIALAIEDGDLSLAERRLRDAQDRLAEALERGASDKEISKLMEEMRQAMSQFMKELAKRFAQNPQANQQAQNQNSQNLRQKDLDQMMNRIEDLAKSGSRDAARQLLQELQSMMNNLQMAQPQQNQRGKDPFSEQMDKLGDMMRQQQQLMDQTFQQQQDQQRGKKSQQKNGKNSEQKQLTPEEFAEAMKKLQKQQGDLQSQMQQMQKDMKELGLDPGKSMGDAEKSMGQAKSNLGKGQPGDAAGNQSRALQAMRKGAQRMMQNMQQQAGEQGRRGERGQHGQQARRDNDPLGRRSRSRGPQLGDDTKVPGEIDAQRAREILEAIRRRLGEFGRPKLELDYLDRLLPTR